MNHMSSVYFEINILIIKQKLTINLLCQNIFIIIIIYSLFLFVEKCITTLERENSFQILNCCIILINFSIEKRVIHSFFQYILNFKCAITIYLLKLFWDARNTWYNIFSLHLYYYIITYIKYFRINQLICLIKLIYKEC